LILVKKSKHKLLELMKKEKENEFFDFCVTIFPEKAIIKTNIYKKE